MKDGLVVFDLDGTLLDTLTDLAAACNHVLAAAGLPTHTADQIRMFVGNGIPKLIERAVPAGTEPALYQQVLAHFVSWYGDHASEHTEPYPGIVELLQELKARGVKVAVNTNKREETAIDLCRHFFPGLIDLVAGGRPDVPHKPDPRGVIRIMEELHVQRKRTVYVGDSDVDWMTALNAGIDGVCVLWGFRDEAFLKNHGVTRLAPDASSLKAYILDRMKTE